MTGQPTRVTAWWTAGTVGLCAAAAAVALAPAGWAYTIVAATAVVSLIGARVASQRARTAETDTDAPAATRTRKHMWLPLWIAAGWMLGTYGLFWLTGLTPNVRDPWLLTVYVTAGTVAFAAGYSLYVLRQPATITVEGNRWEHQHRDRRLVFASAYWFIVFGADQLAEYGASGLADIAAKVSNPGAAYQAKFGVYETYQAVGGSSSILQALTLAGGLYGVLGPLAVVYWQKLTLAVKLLALAGLGVYGLYFLYIGTQKGLGDIVVMLLVGALAGAAGTWWRRGPDGKRPKVFRYGAIAIAALLVYMVSAQAGRADEFNVDGPLPTNPTVAGLVGQRTAVGVASVLFYPTHGYLGLSYNLGTTFEWTGGLGASTAVASYATQYLHTAAPMTYPVRTEARTGWPAGQYWATVYPWLASDLTFPGAVVAMLLFGWLFARMWVEGGIRRDTLALVIFGQLAIAVAYIPANDQLGSSRHTTIGMATLLGLYVLRAVRRSVGTRPPAASVK